MQDMFGKEATILAEVDVPTGTYQTLTEQLREVRTQIESRA